MQEKITFIPLVFLISIAGCDNGEDYVEQANIMAANVELVEQAHTGDVAALELLVACLENADPYPEQNQETYYWLIRLQDASEKDYSNELGVLENSLTEDEKDLVEMWFMDLPDTPMIPWVTKINCFPEKY